MLEVRVRDDLVLGEREQLVVVDEGHGQAAFRAERSADLLWCGFSQMTVPPWPSPMHIVVMPYLTSRALGELRGELVHQAHTARCQRWPTAIAPPTR